jgi:hypothetical protein
MLLILMLSGKGKDKASLYRPGKPLEIQKAETPRTPAAFIQPPPPNPQRYSPVLNYMVTTLFYLYLYLLSLF